MYWIGSGQAVEFGFVTGKLLLSTTYNLRQPPETDNQINILVYQSTLITTGQMPGPLAKDHEKNDQV